MRLVTVLLFTLAPLITHATAVDLAPYEALDAVHAQISGARQSISMLKECFNGAHGEYDDDAVCMTLNNYFRGAAEQVAENLEAIADNTNDEALKVALQIVYEQMGDIPETEDERDARSIRDETERTLERVDSGLSLVEDMLENKRRELSLVKKLREAANLAFDNLPQAVRGTLESHLADMEAQIKIADKARGAALEAEQIALRQRREAEQDLAKINGQRDRMKGGRQEFSKWLTSLEKLIVPVPGFTLVHSFSAATDLPHGFWERLRTEVRNYVDELRKRAPLFNPSVAVILEAESESPGTWSLLGRRSRLGVPVKATVYLASGSSTGLKTEITLPKDPISAARTLLANSFFTEVIPKKFIEAANNFNDPKYLESRQLAKDSIQEFRAKCAAELK